MTAARQKLVMIPGLLCDARLWAHQSEHLSDIADCSVADITGAESVDALADRVLAAALERFALAGLSMGGYVPHAIMRRAPGRVTRLALIDTSARADTEDQLVRRKQLIDMTRFGKFKGQRTGCCPSSSTRTGSSKQSLQKISKRCHKTLFLKHLHDSRMPSWAVPTAARS
jgi:pimeloyl-ACP methyl ester carboxylesterase